MALGAFPKFLSGTYYADYLQAKVVSEVLEKREEKGQVSDESDLEKHLTIQAKMSLELDKMLAGTSWLSGLLSSIESLPVCVSLAAASRNMRGFPLIYVNAAFETTTGYDRSEILGQVREDDFLPFLLPSFTPSFPPSFLPSFPSFLPSFLPFFLSSFLWDEWNGQGFIIIILLLVYVMLIYDKSEICRGSNKKKVV